MKITQPENSNYAAAVVRVTSITPLNGMTNVVGTPLLGYQAIVSKDVKVGDLGLVFPAESQLSLEYAAKNNLHRHGNLNKDEGIKGYLEDNRRVKAMKFMGHRSDCLFMPLTSIAYTGVNPDELHEGDLFDNLNNHPICKKHGKEHRGMSAQQIAAEKAVRVDKVFLPEHYDTDNYFRSKHTIPTRTKIVVTQKLHGTSIRIAHTYVNRQLTVRDKIAKALGVKVLEQEFDHVYGSHHVIKDINNPNQKHFYSSDIWTQEGKRLQGILPANFIVYGELIGWEESGAPIMPGGYTYKVPEKTCDLYVYRIAFINSQGLLTDLSWEHVKEFCKKNGLRHVPELWSGQHRSFKVDNFLDKRFVNEGYTQAVPLEDIEGLVDEGVCIRAEGMRPKILKAKSPLFFEHETKMKDQNQRDLEEEEATL